MMVDVSVFEFEFRCFNSYNYYFKTSRNSSDEVNKTIDGDAAAFAAQCDTRLNFGASTGRHLRLDGGYRDESESIEHLPVRDVDRL